MKEIKSYFFNLPKGVKLIVGINIIVYLVSIISFSCFSFDINSYLGIYTIYSDQFRFYQLITNMFTHSYYPTHIILNLIFLILFSVSFERMFGFKKYILMYFLCGISCSIFYIKLQNTEFEYTSKKLTSMGIDYKKINEFNTYDYPKETREIVKRYEKSKYSGIGASGSVFGFITSFIIFNIRPIKKSEVFVLLSIGLYEIYLNIINFFSTDYELIGSSIGHVGGIIGGLIFSIYIKLKKET